MKRTYCDRCKKEIINTQFMNAISRKMATYEIIPHYSGPGIKVDLCDECQTKVDNLLHDFFANREENNEQKDNKECCIN